MNSRYNTLTQLDTIACVASSMKCKDFLRTEAQRARLRVDRARRPQGHNGCVEYAIDDSISRGALAVILQ